MLGQLIGGFVTIIIGVSLVSPIANQINAAVSNGTTGGTNVTGAAKTILELTNLFYSLAIVSAGIGITVQALKATGMVGI